jgi:hypothetical protein
MLIIFIEEQQKWQLKIEPDDSEAEARSNLAIFL